jgi:hypothetical protein
VSQEKTPKFPNGFTSWYETYYLIVEAITEFLLEAKKNPPIFQDSAARYGIAHDWTNEFEKRNKGKEWDGEWRDEVQVFAKQKLRSVSK